MYIDDDQFETLLRKALAAGEAAADSVIPSPMTVVDYPLFGMDGSGATYTAEDGWCGGAMILVHDSRTKFARWLLRNDRAKKGQSLPCVVIAVPHRGYSLHRAMAYARGSVAALKKAGVRASMRYFID